MSLFSFYNLIIKLFSKPYKKGGYSLMEKSIKISLTETEKMFKDQIERESYIRSLMDDFSVVDRVNEMYSGGGNNG